MRRSAPLPSRCATAIAASQLPAELQAEITPKNILMIGPTGVGKTEIARRLAKMADAPFIKVEATKFTQVGYVGRDVESIIRDLMETAVGMVHEERVVGGARARGQGGREEDSRYPDGQSGLWTIWPIVPAAPVAVARRQMRRLASARCHDVAVTTAKSATPTRCPGTPPQADTQVGGRAPGPQRAGRADDRDRA